MHYQEVLSVDSSRGFAMFWNDDTNATVGTSSAHHIDLFVDGEPGSPAWRLTGFYGWAATAERHKSWKLLRDLYDLDASPCVVIGDFNEILNSGEKLDGVVRSEGQMRDFRDAVGYCDLVDLGFCGPLCTWWHTLTWWDIYGRSRVRHLPLSDSDHVPILLQASTSPLPLRRSHYLFKFEAFWLLHEEYCDGVMKEAWLVDVVGTPMCCVMKKIKATRLNLDAWQKEKFRTRQISMLAVRGRLEELVDSPISPTVLEERRQLHDRLRSLLSQEERFWQQRAKIAWLQYGDRNTAYFHRKAANRKSKNYLVGSFDEDGNWRDDEEGMEEIVTSYFSTMFQAQPLDMQAIGTVLDAITPSVTTEMDDSLIAPYD